MALTSLYLIRHGHTLWHDTGGVAGRTDIDLSDAGREAVRQLATIPILPQAWYCSPMRRTRETSSLLRQHWPSVAADPAGRALPEEMLDPRLVELDFGDWEGMTWSDVHTQHGDVMSQWAEDWVNRAPPSGERFADQVARCQHWLSDTRRELETVDSAAAVVVTHGGSIRALMCSCLGWPLERAMSFRVDPATVCHLQWHDSHGWLVRGINTR